MSRPTKFKRLRPPIKQKSLSFEGVLDVMQNPIIKFTYALVKIFLIFSDNRLKPILKLLRRFNPPPQDYII